MGFLHPLNIRCPLSTPRIRTRGLSLELSLHPGDPFGVSGSTEFRLEEKNMSNSVLVQLYFKGCSSPICLLLLPLQRSQIWMLGFKAMFSRKESVEYVYSILPIAGTASLLLRIVLLWGQISRWEICKVRGQGRMDSK